jgi:hypothetical protein
MDLVLPFWFKQRQAKVEPAGPDVVRVTAPNQQEAFLLIRQEANGRHAAALRLAAAGPDVAATGAEYDTPGEAWNAAFELYRSELVT